MTPKNKKHIESILVRGVVTDAFPSMEKLRTVLLSEKKLRIYIGADPTSSSLHLSHAKNYILLEEFRRLGHEVIVLFGDFTAMIGDPTDRQSARTKLSSEKVKENVRDWMRQIKPLMDFEAKRNPPRIMYNSKWLAKLKFEDILDLASNFSVQRMLERDMFEKRMSDNKPIFLHEFMYPLMQGYDSVAMEIDVEMCGTDQTFNALIGRTLVKRYLGKEKFVLTVNLMENPVTGDIMSKSRGNGVFLDSSPFDMYGSVMAQPDEMIKPLLVNITRLPLDKVAMITGMEDKRNAKMITALEITKIFHGDSAAWKAQDKFISLVQKKTVHSDITTVKIGRTETELYDIVRKCLDKETSNSQIRRLIDQNAVKIDNQAVKDSGALVKVPNSGVIVKVGKKKWFNILP